VKKSRRRISYWKSSSISWSSKLVSYRISSTLRSKTEPKSSIEHSKKLSKCRKSCS